MIEQRTRDTVTSLPAGVKFFILGEYPVPWTGYWFITEKFKIAVDFYDGWWVKTRFNEETRKLEANKEDERTTFTTQNLEELYHAAEEVAEDIAEYPEEPDEEAEEDLDEETSKQYTMAMQTFTQTTQSSGQANHAFLKQTDGSSGNAPPGGNIPNGGQPSGRQPGSGNGPPGGGGGPLRGSGGPPGGGGGPPGGGGGPPIGNPGQGPRADSKLEGNAPEVFDGTRAKARAWKEAVELYCLINNQHPKMRDQVACAGLMLTFCRGEKVYDWVRQQVDWLRRINDG
ncbi:hypothetical protein EDB83DRAFT_2531756 [Lactarius deliciosus]|nr:hypothetical protein EDB83DRAFT_2531756 [Lactarius deliciosus]